MNDRLTATMSADSYMIEYTTTESNLRKALEDKDLVKAKIFKQALVNLLKQKFAI